MKKLLFPAIFLVCLSQSLMAQWPPITQASKPWTRWWWMGSAVDKENLTKQLTSFKQVGLGGVEIVPIYGAIGYEPNYIKYLSPNWMAMLDHTVKTATTQQLGVYMSVGTGWPIGGPQVKPEDAAAKLIIQTYEIRANSEFNELIEVKDPKQKAGARLIALTAYREDGQAEIITDRVDDSGKLSWQPANGNLKLYAAFLGRTKQMVKRAAPGGEGYTLDHFSATALPNYLQSFDTAFGKTSDGVKAFYNDSYEVYNADWTPSFFTEFQRLRKYDLRLHLHQLVSKDSTEMVARIKSDYRQTISELMLKNFAGQFTGWAHSKKALSLNQAHGSPGNLLDLYAAFDISEAETFGSSAFEIPGIRRDSADIRNVNPDPIMLKFASSAAHAMGNKLTSCETFTWLTEHFKTSWSQCKPEVEQAFLAGINHVFYHGTTYSPAEVKWPGWLFYASVNFVPTNSLWPHLQGLNNFIARCQAVLQYGSPDNEILTYWPVYDAWSNPKGLDMPFKVHDIDDWLYPAPFYQNTRALQAAGYALDFVSDKMLSTAQVSGAAIRVSKNGALHKVLLIPKCRYMPVETLQNILRMAKEGAMVIMQDLPEDVPGLANLDQNRESLKKLVAAVNFTTNKAGIKEFLMGKGKVILASDVQDALKSQNIFPEQLTKAGLKFIRRSAAGEKYYFIVNHTGKNVDESIALNYAATNVLISDPLTGNSGLAQFQKSQGKTLVRLQLQPGESVLVKMDQEPSSGHQWHYVENSARSIVLTSPWTLQFTAGGPSLPASLEMDQPRTWTSFAGDTSLLNFSGTGRYTTSFQLPVKPGGEYLLKLDRLCESAQVIINGKDAGLIWSVPYQLRIGKYLQPGVNTISLEVSNLMANRIRYMDRHKMEWRKYHEINFVNINYKNFNAADWSVQPSGLEGPVTILPLK
ncbi:MAG: glycosyl hydrolase [Bacteroidota bacterium]